MKSVKLISLVLAMLFCIVSNAQEKTITGIVSDSSGQPLSGASIVVKKTNRSTQTDYDGKYSIKASKGEVLIFSFVGMQNSSVTVSDSNVINVKLRDSQMQLEEVVVTGYGRTETKSRKVSTTQTVTNRPNANANFLQSTRGQVSGLALTTNAGTPGNNTLNVIIRGANSVNASDPLYVIDGVPMTQSTAKNINANDIGSVTVIKDAKATSLYGNRGANGVVVISTKNELYKNKSPKEIKKLLKESEITESPLLTAPTDEDYDNFIENSFESPKTAPLSTFSIDVDNASYTNIRRFINAGQKVPKDAVRVEEMVNFFKYEYPQPKDEHPFSINTEYSDCPWNSDSKLVRIGLQGKIIPSDNLPASNLVFLIDVSGSMSDANKLPLVKESLKVLINQLRDEDRISIVVYAGAAGLVLPSTKGNQKQTIISALDKLQSGGSTAGGAGIQLAYQTATDNFIKGGNNRVILATDGDFNVGASSDSDMQTLIEEKRKSGVFLTCLGYGMGNYKDSKMETLADKGNGNYAYIDNIQEANRFLGKEFKGSMFAIAKDVKIQIEFNPAQVASYRLIGYENRKLNAEDFKNDAIDAGELGSGHTVTALYEIIPAGVKSKFYNEPTDLKYTKTEETKTKFNSELATVKFRYKKPDGDKSIEMVSIIENKSEKITNASNDLKFSSAVAWFGLKLRDSKFISNKSMSDIKKLAKEGLAYDDQGYRAEFIRLLEALN